MYYSVYYRLDPDWYREHGDQVPAGQGNLARYAAEPTHPHSVPHGPFDAQYMRESAVADMQERWPTVPDSAWITGEIEHRDDYRGFVWTSIPIHVDADWLKENGDQPYYADGLRLSALLEQQVHNPSPSDEEYDDSNVEWAEQQTLQDLTDEWPTVPQSAWIIDGSNVDFDTDEFDLPIVEDEDVEDDNDTE